MKNISGRGSVPLTPPSSNTRWCLSATSATRKRKSYPVVRCVRPTVRRSERSSRIRVCIIIIILRNPVFLKGLVVRRCSGDGADFDSTITTFSDYYVYRRLRNSPTRRHRPTFSRTAKAPEKIVFISDTSNNACRVFV